MLRTIKRRGVALIAGLGLALSIAACASQAKVQDQPLLNQLMAPNGFVIQQPAQSNQMDANTAPLFDRVEQAPLYRASRGAEALGYGRQSPPARAMADYFLKDHTPSANQGKARLRGLYRIIYSKTISPRLYGARPICAGATLRMRAEALPERVEAPAGLWRAHR
jgi:hypothetical protein